jgi:hypothetical protein
LLEDLEEILNHHAAVPVLDRLRRVASQFFAQQALDKGRVAWRVTPGNGVTLHDSRYSLRITPDYHTLHCGRNDPVTTLVVGSVNLFLHDRAAYEANLVSWHPLLKGPLKKSHFQRLVVRLVPHEPARAWRACGNALRENCDDMLALVGQFLRDPETTLLAGSHCGCCGKKLTDALSRERGIGPECWGGWQRLRAATTVEEVLAEV